MSKQEILDKLKLLNREQELRWMINLGTYLTICARDAYPVQEQSGNIHHLMGFNEIQHRIYGRIRHLARGEEWTIESFLEGMLEKAQYHQVQGGLNWALGRALQEIQ